MIKEIACQTGSICCDTMKISYVNVHRNLLRKKLFWLTLHGFYEMNNPVRLVKTLPQKCEQSTFYSFTDIKRRRPKRTPWWLSLLFKYLINLIMFPDDCIPLTLFLEKVKSLFLVMLLLIKAVSNITHVTVID